MTRLYAVLPLSLCLCVALLSECTLSAKEPLPVYILAGQSNMQGHASVSTFDHVGMDPKTAP